MTGNHQPAPSQRPFDPPTGDSTPRRVLEEILRQTAEAYSLEPAPDPADLECLQAVAARLRGVEFQLAPVLIELVRATLDRQFGQGLARHPASDRMVARVAEALYDNPESQARLKALWEGLQAP